MLILPLFVSATCFEIILRKGVTKASKRETKLRRASLRIFMKTLERRKERKTLKKRRKERKRNIGRMRSRRWRDPRQVTSGVVAC